MEDERPHILSDAQATLSQMIRPDLASRLWISIIDAPGPDGGTVEAHLQISGPDAEWARAYDLLVGQTLMGEVYHWWPDAQE